MVSMCRIRTCNCGPGRNLWMVTNILMDALGARQLYSINGGSIHACNQSVQADSTSCFTTPKRMIRFDDFRLFILAIRSSFRHMAGAAFFSAATEDCYSTTTAADSLPSLEEHLSELQAQCMKHSCMQAAFLRRTPRPRKRILLGSRATTRSWSCARCLDCM